jgi:ComF family protein
MVNSFFEWLLPSACLLCGLKPNGAARASADLCVACADDLPHIGQYCRHCGLPLPVTGLCGLCQVRPPPYSRCISPLLYQAPVSHLVAHFKYSGRLAYGRLLSGVLLQRLREEAELGADLIVPVPLHWRRRWTRGFNQAEIIADEISRALRLPLQTRDLIRVRPTPPQQSLSAVERRKNLRAAFAVKRAFTGRDIALVDDVVTTGATVSEISQLLLSAGANSVQVWCLARTP